MRLEATEDEATVAALFEDFFSSECPPAAVRSAEALGHDPAAWARFAETGGPGILAPPTAGGGGADLTTAAMIAAAAGRHIAPLPVVEHLAATAAIAGADPDVGLLAGLADGSRIGTIALTGADVVPAGAVAHIVVARRDDDGIAVVVDDPPLRAAPNGPRLPLAGRHLGDAGSIADTGWRRAVATWHALMATALAALGRRAVELGVDYVGDRHQFGVPIGTFQAVQHGLADAATRIEGAALLASRAVWALDTGRTDGTTLAAMAFLNAAEAAQQATATALQYHGGYGYAEEYDIQLYHRRARGWALQAGDPALEYRRLATELLPRTGTG